MPALRSSAAGEASPKSRLRLLGVGTSFRAPMGKFDSRNSPKMTRRKGQAKKKARLKRRAEATRASRTTTKKPKKK